MNKTVFMIKHTYAKALNRLMSTGDKFDFVLANIAETIQKLAKAHSACITANMLEQKVKIEEKIKELYAKKNNIEEKRAEYTAKIAYLEAQRDAALLCAKVSNTTNISVDSVISECDNYIKQLNAEIETAGFLSLL